ncbi:MAG TPA: UDP-N-acetylmuramate--L-alanine ligase, partial [bacterium]|nr:UDP-N-acetylmuramate--L-alanine ligase [bacterium]
EPPIAGVDSPLLVEGVRRHGQPEVVYFPRREIQDALPGFVSPGDVLLTLGAGDVWKCGDNFLKSKRPHKRRKGN